MKQFLWECECGMRVLSITRPKDRTWGNGHTCKYERVRKPGEPDLPMPSKICPKCKKRTLFEDNEFNLLSVDMIYICPLCGVEELSNELYELRKIPD